jgi:cell wall-associated NlpC family hydrolase
VGPTGVLGVKSYRFRPVRPGSFRPNPTAHLVGVGEDSGLSKHRRPSRLSRVAHIANSPLQLSIAAGVAGTVAVTGTVVANAAPNTALADDPTESTATQLVVADTSDLTAQSDLASQREAVAGEQRERAERIAAARAKAIAKRKAAKEAAERKAEQRREARKVASESRTLSSASRSVERMSASAANVLAIAAQAASGAYYAHGGSGPTAFDCSGFTSYVFSKVGVSLPHSSSAQRGVVQSVSDPQPGDLVFVYNGGGGSIGHVAIYAGGGMWWEASNPSTGVGKHYAWSSAVSYGRVL